MAKIRITVEPDYPHEGAAEVTFTDEATVATVLEGVTKMLRFATYGDESIRFGYECEEHNLYETISASSKLMKERRDHG